MKWKTWFIVRGVLSRTCRCVLFFPCITFCFMYNLTGGCCFSFLWNKNGLSFFLDHPLLARLFVCLFIAERKSFFDTLKISYKPIVYWLNHSQEVDVEVYRKEGKAVKHHLENCGFSPKHQLHISFCCLGKICFFISLI